MSAQVSSSYNRDGGVVVQIGDDGSQIQGVLGWMTGLFWNNSTSIAGAPLVGVNKEVPSFNCCANEEGVYSIKWKSSQDDLRHVFVALMDTSQSAGKTICEVKGPMFHSQSTLSGQALRQKCGLWGKGDDFYAEWSRVTLTGQSVVLKGQKHEVSIDPITKQGSSRSFQIKSSIPSKSKEQFLKVQFQDSKSVEIYLDDKCILSTKNGFKTIKRASQESGNQVEVNFTGKATIVLSALESSKDWTITREGDVVFLGIPKGGNQWGIAMKVSQIELKALKFGEFAEGRLIEAGCRGEVILEGRGVEARLFKDTDSVNYQDGKISCNVQGLERDQKCVEGSFPNSKLTLPSEQAAIGAAIGHYVSLSQPSALEAKMGESLVPVLRERRLVSLSRPAQVKVMSGVCVVQFFVIVALTCALMFVVLEGVQETDQRVANVGVPSRRILVRPNGPMYVFDGKFLNESQRYTEVGETVVDLGKDNKCFDWKFRDLCQF